MSLTGGLSAGLVAGLSGRAMAGVSAADPPFPAMTGTVDYWLDGERYFTDVGATTPATSQGDAVAAWVGANGTVLPQSTSAARLRLKTDTANGRTALIPLDCASTQHTGFAGSNLSLDRRSCTLWAVTRSVAIGGGDYAYFNVGAGLTDMLIDTTGVTAGGPNRIRLFNFLTSTVVPLGSPQLIVVSCGASSVTVSIDDVTQTSGSAFSAGTVTGGTVFYRSDPGYRLDAEIHAFGILNQQITAGDLADLKAWAYARYRPWAVTKQIVCQGDSITEGQNATLGRNWPVTAVDTILRAGWRVENQAFSGTDCMTVAGKISTGSTALYDGSLAKNVYCHFLGTNDLGALGRTAAQLITDTDTCLTAMRGAGFLTAVATIPDRTGSVDWDGTKDGHRQTFNTAVRSGGSLNSLADVVVDLAADSLIDDPTNTTYRSIDKLHYTQVGSDRIASLFAAGVVTL